MPGPITRSWVFENVFEMIPIVWLFHYLSKIHNIKIGFFRFPASFVFSLLLIEGILTNAFIFYANLPVCGLIASQPMRAMYFFQRIYNMIGHTLR